MSETNAMSDQVFAAIKNGDRQIINVLQSHLNGNTEELGRIFSEAHRLLTERGISPESPVAKLVKLIVDDESARSRFFSVCDALLAEHGFADDEVTAADLDDEDMEAVSGGSWTHP